MIDQSIITAFHEQQEEHWNSVAEGKLHSLKREERAGAANKLIADIKSGVFLPLSENRDKLCDVFAAKINGLIMVGRKNEAIRNVDNYIAASEREELFDDALALVEAFVHATGKNPESHIDLKSITNYFKQMKEVKDD